MAGRLSKQYRFVVRKSEDTYADKPVAEGILTQKRETIRHVRAEVTKAGVGAHGAVYAGEKLNTLVYQVRNTYDDAGAAGKLVVEEL
jgi:hypothetical protein